MPVEELGKLERAWAGFRIMGGDGTAISGSPRDGYTFNVEDCGSSGSGAAPVLGCTDPAATNFDPAATLDDGSCTYPPPTGACCFDDNNCEVLTATDCSNAGGTYQGDGVPCSPNPCGCPSVSLVCDSISASLSKCGNDGFQGSGKKYLTYNQDWVYSSSFNSIDPACDSSVTCCHCSESDVHGFQSDYNPISCISIQTGCYGTVTRTSDSHCNGGGDRTESWYFDVDGICRSHPDEIYPTTCPGACLPNDVIVSDTFVTHDCSDANSDLSLHETLSNEYTTAMLKSNVASSLPAYDNDYNDSCSASTNLSGDEHSDSIQRFKPRFTFATAPTDFTISYNEHFIPDVGAPSNTPRSINVLAGATFADGNEVFEPGSNGTITITNILVTC